MTYQPKQAPEACTTLNAIRNEIDGLDQAIIHLLSQRHQYVKCAARFKKSSDEVQAQARVDSMLQQREAWAQQLGLPPGLIEKMYLMLVEGFINEEKKQWSADQHL